MGINRARNPILGTKKIKKRCWRPTRREFKLEYIEILFSGRLEILGAYGCEAAQINEPFLSILRILLLSLAGLTKRTSRWAVVWWIVLGGNIMVEEEIYKSESMYADLTGGLPLVEIPVLS